jgi:DNA invertase Pin-like site-specific DNA recombinase
MARIGYERVFTIDQHLHAQTAALADAGCERVFTDQGVSGTKEPGVPNSTPAWLTCGPDELVVWKPDRLGRSVSHQVQFVAHLGEQQIGLVSLTVGFDTTTARDRVLFHILAALAEMERELIRERTLAGLERARRDRRLGGRHTFMTPERVKVASTLLAEGQPVSEVDRVLGVGRASLYRARPIGSAAACWFRCRVQAHDQRPPCLIRRLEGFRGLDQPLGSCQSTRRLSRDELTLQRSAQQPGLTSDSADAKGLCPAGCTGHAAMCQQRHDGGLVFREIKERRRKTVPLPPELVAILREHRQAQDGERELAANEWCDRGLVFCQANGVPIDSRADWQEWSDILVEAGLPHAGPHSMRHSAATIALDQGVPLAVVQEMLGHSDIRITRAYSHVSSPLARDGARRIGDALFGEK